MAKKEILSEQPKIEIVNADCLDYLKEIPDNSIDCVITDPPAGIGFMGKEWDDFGRGLSARDKFIGWLEKIAKECLRVIKPGGHALVWALPRTSHWTATAWENAGWEVRDRIGHIFGSGFPKSLNIGKQIKKIIGKDYCRRDWRFEKTNEWKDWGTALKPAVEDWWLLRKPLEKGLSVAENVLKWGTGGINIDACRIDYVSSYDAKHQSDIARGQKNAIRGKFFGGKGKSLASTDCPMGRFPAHLIHDGSDEVVGLFPKNQSRFFYCAKASKQERDAGLDLLEYKDGNIKAGIVSMLNKTAPKKNNHPTVKPVKLMEYLIKLICPPNGIILDPFMGSGTTLVAAARLGRKCIGIEINEKYCEIAKQRIEAELKQNKLL